MNKMLIGSVGLAGLLASCNVSVSTPGNGNPSGSLSLSNVVLAQSSYRLSQDVRDQNGRPIPAGTYIICDDRSTDVRVNVNWSGGIQKLGVQFKGLTTGNTSNVVGYSAPYATVDTSGYGSFDISIPSGVAPLSVKPSGMSAQSIVVNPVTNVNIIGSTYVQALGIDAYGNYSNTVQSSQALPVASACSS